MSGTETDDVRLALVLQKQQQDEEDIRELKKDMAALKNQALAGKIVLLTLVGIGGFFGWLINAGDKVRSWFH
ncbi:MAG TPA: hypothetical protein VII92_15155 [Anaerolineae bacterium]